MNHHVTKLGLTFFERALILVIPAAIGGILGWFIPVIVDGLKRIPFLSSNDLIILFDSFHPFSVSVTAMIFGITAGFILSVIIFNESLSVFIDDAQIKLVIKEEETAVSKNSITAIFIEGKRLKLLDNEGKELFSGEIDMSTEKVKDAFLSHFYPWKDEDPYKSCFQLWRLDEEMALGETIQSILYSRRLSLREKDVKKANQLKNDLNELGVIVKDRGEEQLIRRITRG